MRWARLVLAVVVVLVAAPARADFQAGVEAYERGDYATALTEFRPLAQQGVAEAQFNLGHMYFYGQGVPQDDAEAVRWFRRATEQGHAEARFNLGFMYHEGRGVPQDYEAAMRWYRRAAEQGHDIAHVKMGIMYAKGEGAPQDYVQAHMWYNLAAAGGHKDAGGFRNTLAKRMTPAQIAEAQRLAREWKPKQ